MPINPVSRAFEIGFLSQEAAEPQQKAFAFTTEPEFCPFHEEHCPITHQPIDPLPLPKQRN
jgi:hypothetical protein